MKKTSEILLAMIAKDSAITREEIRLETGMTFTQIDCLLYFLKKKKLILVEKISLKNFPYRGARYKLNPMRADYLVKKLHREGVELI